MSESLTHLPAVIETSDDTYSRRIKKLRLFLPFVALLIAAIVFTWQERDTSITPPPQDNTQKPEATNEVIAPRFETVDADGRPILVKAETARQDPNNESVILLDQARGTWTLDADQNTTIQVSATQGTYRQDTQILALREHVAIIHSDGVRLETNEIDADLEHKLMVSDQQTTLTHQGFILRAAGFEANIDQERVRFIGPVSVTIKDQTIFEQWGHL